MGEDKGSVLVTGACGLIGTALTEKLAEKYRVVGLDIVDSPSEAPFAAYHKVDLTSEESVKRGLELVGLEFGRKIAAIVHLAAYYSFSEEESPLYDEVTVLGTERLLRLAQTLDVEQFLFSSTMLVHAPSPRPGVRVNEDSPVEAKWAYPESKERTEAVIHERRGAIPTVIARIAGVYDDWCHSIPISHQIQRIFERQMTGKFYPGDLSRGQSFIHREDLVEALSRIVDRRRGLGPETVFLVGEEETLGYGELQRRFGDLIHGKEWETKTIPKALAKTGAWLEDHIPGHDPFIKPWMVDLADDHYELDVSRAKEALDWEPKHSLAETLPKMIENLKADPERWYRENKLELPTRLRRKAG